MDCDILVPACIPHQSCHFQTLLFKERGLDLGDVFKRPFDGEGECPSQTEYHDEKNARGNHHFHQRESFSANFSFAGHLIVLNQARCEDGQASGRGGVEGEIQRDRSALQRLARQTLEDYVRGASRQIRRNGHLRIERKGCVGRVESGVARAGKGVTLPASKCTPYCVSFLEERVSTLAWFKSEETSAVFLPSACDEFKFA